MFHGDNLAVLRQYVSDDSVDLIYLDPPFNKNQDFKLLFAREDQDSINSRTAYSDNWKWNDLYSDVFQEAVNNLRPEVARTLTGFRLILGESGMLAYLTMMAPRLHELRRSLKSTGSIYLHCDSTASSFLRILMDAVFGADNFLNCIVWCYGLGGSTKRRWPSKHDDILWYSREPGKHYFEAAMIPATSQRMKGKLKKAPDYWNIPTINNMAKERLGYPTQKPEALLERIISSSSKEGDVILDPFCGSGTTLAVANKLNRRWIGIDSGSIAIELARKRLTVLTSKKYNFQLM